jgi:hypothetical protein
MVSIRAVSIATATTIAIASALIISASVVSDAATWTSREVAAPTDRSTSSLERAVRAQDQRDLVRRQHQAARADRNSRINAAKRLAELQRKRATAAAAKPKSAAASTSVAVNVPERTAGQRVTDVRGLSAWQQRYWNEGQVWATWPKTRAVIACESTNNPTAVSKTGKYRGLYQMDASFWRSYGGLALASSPDRATRAEQNYVAYRGYTSRGWSPWTCA